VFRGDRVINNRNGFDVISLIDLTSPNTWKNKIFLTFDVDWAHDDVLADTIDLVERADVPATWFVTHDTKLLARLRENPKFEIGLHPNFNELLAGKLAVNESATSIMKKLVKLVPSVKAIRSHSLVQSERLVDLFSEFGCTHISNFYIPENAIETLAPWGLWGNITAVPHCWQDNVSMRMNGFVKAPKGHSNGSLNVIDFHPIHVFLNSENIARYEQARPWFQMPQELASHRNEQTLGARDILKSVMGGA
jgi:hypothetical protein